MKKYLLIIFIICMLSNVCFAITSNGVQIGTLEKQFFGCQFQKDSEIKRLDRIEEYLYGSASTGNLTTRLKNINTDLGFSNSISSKNSTSKTASSKKSETPPKVVYEKEDPTVSYPIVDKMEAKIFNQVHNKENIYTRVARLEKQVYNQSNINDSLDNRVNKLRLSILDTTPNDSISYNDKENYSYGNSFNENDSNNNNDFEYNSPQKSKQDYFNMELTSLEKVILSDSYSTDSTDNRLNRLEAKVFQRTFANDNKNERLERITAASTAKKTSSQYDNNKLMKRLNTGAQIGSILLIILAMIL